MKPFTRDDLAGMKPKHDAFVGIDSDGCVFNTMEVKQKGCFHGLIIEHWKLQAIEPLLRETSEFVNLRSSWRGSNRFPCLLRVFELLAKRPEVLASGVSLPDCAGLRLFVESGRPLSNAELSKMAKETGRADLARLLAWSEAVNNCIATTIKSVPPFPWAAWTMFKIQKHADAICVSQTPTETLVNEWQESKLLKFIRGIAGQEIGTKAEHLRLATAGKYRPDRVLMMGDARGDLKAAREAGALFYPIIPGKEDESWHHFHVEAFDLFLAGRYAGEHENELVAEFEAMLPDDPPWSPSAANSNSRRQDNNQQTITTRSP